VDTATLTEFRPLLATVFGVIALLVLILRARMNAFIALILVSIFSAIAAGLAPEAAFDTITRGMGGTLGFIAIVIGLGALFGAILESTGGVSALADAMVKNAKPGGGRWRMGGLGLLAATPVFFDVALIILAPLVLAMSKRTGRAALAFGLPLLAGLTAAHSFIPPTPGPMAIAELIGADLGLVILFGSIIGFAAMAVGGVFYSAFLERSGRMPVGEMALATHQDSETIEPRAGAARLTAIIIVSPLLLILMGTLAQRLLDEGLLRDVFTLVGHPFTALLLACGAAYQLLRSPNPAAMARVKAGIARALEPTGAIILVTGAGGAFKQVLVDSGAGGQLAEAAQGVGMTPLVAGYVLALLVRVAQGSATVAMITAAGLVAPLTAAAHLSQPQLALVAIAVAAGASALSHVNDSGFWLVNRIFGLTERDTFLTWTATTTLLSITGFVLAGLLYMVV